MVSTVILCAGFDLVRRGLVSIRRDEVNQARTQLLCAGGVFLLVLAI